jgi:hypothetical protein
VTEDRIVHASNDQVEVVRYDKAGKWYIEPLDRSLPRQAVSVKDAAKHAVWLWYQGNGTVHFDRPGGAIFNRKVRALI